MKLCGFEAGLDQPFFLISGPCVVESEQLQMDVAGQLKEITASLGIPCSMRSSMPPASTRRSGRGRAPNR
jgi:2-dehydro-3-deoxyphosphooctonate aldolase (KDO 8-P synthase)